MRNDSYISEKGYESEEDRLYRELIERADKKNEERKNLKAKLVEVKFEEWLENISKGKCMYKKYPIEIQIDKIESFCQKWKVKEFALFGSILRVDFNPSKSDVDVLLTFLHSQNLSLFDIIDMKEELELIFKRKVDLVNKESIEKSKNPYKKKEILENYEVIYEQAA